MVYPDDVALVSESLKGLNESKTLRVNVKTTKMMISSEKARKVKTQGNFLVEFAERMSNSILCQFFKS